MRERPFSEQLEDWLKDHKPKTLESLEQVFAQKSFAMIILLLMAIPALPIPTGGITHIFEIIVMLLCVELMIGRQFIWLPKKWQKLKLDGKTQDKLLPMLTKRIRWFERFSKPRLKGLLEDPNFLRVIGLIIFVLACAAFWAPPFTGLDTIPSLGVVIICLSLILEDALLLLIGLIIGGIGVAIEVGIGKGIVEVVKAIF